MSYKVEKNDRKELFENKIKKKENEFLKTKLKLSRKNKCMKMIIETNHIKVTHWFERKKNRKRITKIVRFLT